MGFKKGALSDIFRRRRSLIKINDDTPISEQHLHPLSGAVLVLTKIDSKPRPVQGRYAVGWLGEGRQHLWYYKNFQTEADARQFFERHKKDGPPQNNYFKQDQQVNEVYGWEHHFRLKTMALTIPQMEFVTGKLAQIFNMEAPVVTFKPGKKKKTYAEADLQNNKIIMYRPQLALLLHEMAHLVNDQVNQDKWAWHGPGFVRTYLSILSLFPIIAPAEKLEALARESGLSIAKENNVRASRLLRKWRDHCNGDPHCDPTPT
ncbi:MAG: hypothetical protein NDJ24_09430 [Alphaproteobacteria bacterium]|nr:hypothetical protein [Alphaproteobacteria bacterium]